MDLALSATNTINRRFYKCMNNKIKYLLFVLIITFFTTLPGQSFNPIITNYTKYDYKGASQNWSVTQDMDGFIYAGNNNGLLEFDGNSWRLYSIPELKTIRSVFADNNRIYIGSFEEFGFFVKNEKGILQYYSLTPLLNDYNFDNDEIWKIFKFDDKIIFQSFSSFFVYDESKVKGFKLNESVIFFMPWNNKIFTSAGTMKLSTLDPESGKMTKTAGYSSNSPAIAILPYKNNKALLFTLDDGIYIFDGVETKPFTTEISNEIIKGIINKVILTSDSVYVIGTLHNGVIAMHTSGRRMWRLSTNEGLQNNTVLGLMCDNTGNIWVSLDKGISLVKLGSPFRFYNQFDSHIGAIYDIAVTGEKLQIGTNQGLFSCSKHEVFEGNKVNLTLNPSINSQVWKLATFHNQVLCGNNEETFEITESASKKISQFKGGMCINEGSINGINVLVESTYSNMCIYLKDKKGNWYFSHTVDSFLNPVRYVEIDYMGTIWASHIHKGLYSIKLKSNLREIRQIKYYDKLGNTTNRAINVFSLNGRVVFCDGEMIYTYDDLNDEIMPYESLNQSIGIFQTAHRIIHFNENLYWFIRHNEAALIDAGMNNYKIIDIIPFSIFPADHVDEHQNIVPISPTSSLFCLENGLGLYTLHENSDEDVNIHPKIFFRQIEVRSRKKNVEPVLLNLHNGSTVTLSSHFNNIHFDIAFPNFEKSKEVMFNYKLTGLEDSYSSPEMTFSRGYDNLKPGVYTLNVQALDRVKNVLNTISYHFEIRPPFYLTPMAFLIYFLFTILLISIIIYRIRLIIRLKQIKIEKEHEILRTKEIEVKEKQIMKLKNEYLEFELKHKSKELASSAMSIIRKNDILVQIKSELIAQKELLGVHYPQKYFNKVIKLIDSNIRSEDDWAIFQQNFDRIHENFFRNLKSRFPELTAHDLRFCVYLRLNLTSKEIANLLNISNKGVEISRYRIRKKLGLHQKDSLNDFLLNIK